VKIHVAHVSQNVDLFKRTSEIIVHDRQCLCTVETHFLYSTSDVGMPFEYPWISIPASAYYKGRPTQGLNQIDYIDLETKKGNSNMYSTRTLINPSLVAYIKPGRDAPRGTSSQIRCNIQ
jgi:hypothetical protein